MILKLKKKINKRFYTLYKYLKQDNIIVLEQRKIYLYILYYLLFTS